MQDIRGKRLSLGRGGESKGRASRKRFALVECDESARRGGADVWVYTTPAWCSTMKSLASGRAVSLLRLPTIHFLKIHFALTAESRGEHHPLKTKKNRIISVNFRRTLSPTAPNDKISPINNLRLCGHGRSFYLTGGLNWNCAPHSLVPYLYCYRGLFHRSCLMCFSIAIILQSSSAKTLNR